MPTPPKQPYAKKYLDDRHVREWHQTLRLRSKGTADSYLRSMARLWHRLDVQPHEFLDHEQLELDRYCQRVLNGLHEHRQKDGRPLSQTVLKSYRAAMRSWVKWNGKKLERDLIIGRAPVNPRARTYFIPVPRQLQAALDAATKRTRLSIALIAFGGLRFNIQGDMAGENGLTLRLIHGLVIEDRRARAETLPLRIEVPEELSKNNRAFFTYLGPEGADYLLAYLNHRLQCGEDLNPDSPLLAHEKGANNSRAGPFLLTKTITAGIRDAHKKAGLPLPPYIWRSYFSTGLLMAESKNQCVRDYRQFWMGHAGDIEATYNVRKALPPAVLQDMEQRYMASLQFLETRSDPSNTGAAQSVMSAILAGLGCSPEEVAAVDFDDPDPDAVQALIKAKIDAIQPASGPAGPMQRLVAASELQGWLESGWTWAYQAPVPEGMALIEAPGGHAEGSDAPVAA